jgi:hypothetical protein
MSTTFLALLRECSDSCQCPDSDAARSNSPVVWWGGVGGMVLNQEVGEYV